MSTSSNPQQPLPGLPWLLAALGALLAFRAVGASYLRNYSLDLGSLTFPSPLYAMFVLVWMVLGTLALACATVGFARVAARPGAADAFALDWLGPSDRKFVAIASLLAAALPLAFHVLILGGARLTDDEAAYHFTAQLIAQGKLSVPSHPAREFFDNAFMINDGRLYSKYLPGWPLLLAPGAALSMPETMNPLYHALTVPALFGILRHAAGSAWARAGTLLFLTAPMLLVGAATMLSHTSCICVLAWAWWLVIRLQRPAVRLREHAAFALLLALAFFIRPTSAIGIGAPLALVWLRGAWNLPLPARTLRLGTFAGIAAAALACLLAVNAAQTGDPLTLAYARANEYQAEHQEFSALPSEYRHLRFDSPVRMVATSAVGFLRLGFDLFGWPIGLLVLLLAAGDRRARLAWGAMAGFVLVHLPVADLGIDSFGPVHWYEVALPVLVLVTIGFERAYSQLSKLGSAAAALAPALLVAGVACAWIGYVPVRVAALSEMADDITAPTRALESAGVRNAVVFAPRPFALPCGKHPQNWVFFRPNNDPDMRNDVLWANYLSMEKNRALMRHFPGRKGYVLAHGKDCTMGALPLDEIDDRLAKLLDERNAAVDTAADH